MSLRPSGTIASLCSDVLNEASLPSGTWSLATHTRINAAMVERTTDDIEYFMTRVIERLILPGVDITERFKLAQVCTMCRQKHAARVEPILARYQSGITALADSMNTDSLEPAVAKLLVSLFKERVDARPIPALFHPRVMALPRRAIVSRTPAK
jgi:hypothetical protein